MKRDAGPNEFNDGWFELSPEEQQEARETWDPEDRTPLDEFLDDIEEEEDEDEQ